MLVQGAGYRAHFHGLTAIRAVMACAGLLTLGACAIPPGASSASGASSGGALPDGVVAMAATYQDLGSARLMPEDGCYWYRHVGPVETTMLPLRTPDGRRICEPGAAPAAV